MVISDEHLNSSLCNPNNKNKKKLLRPLKCNIRVRNIRKV